MAGRVVCTESSWSTPGRLPRAARTTSATTTVRPARNVSQTTMVTRRSTRSVMTPAGRLKISHGRRLATLTRPIRSGLRVTAEASHG